MIGLSLFVTSLCAACTSGISPRHFEFERGTKGVVPCPAMVDRGYAASDTEAIYWYFKPKRFSDPRKSIIRYFQGNIFIANPEYSISNTSLVISNVSESAEGTYSYKYNPWDEAEIEGSVEVSENVSGSAKVNECSEDEPSCVVTSDTEFIDLTCSVEYSKPPVSIRWFRWSSMKKWEEILANTPPPKPYFCKVSETGCFYVNVTSNSNATIREQLESSKTFFMCTTNSSKLENIKVTVVKTGCDAVNEVTVHTKSEEPTSPATDTSSIDPFTSIWVVGFITCVTFVIVGLVVLLIRFYYRLKLEKRHRRNKGVEPTHCKLAQEELAL